MKLCYYLVAVSILCGMMLPASSQEQVSLTIHVHEDDLNGDLLSAVYISGQDGNDNEFMQTTNSSGVAVVQGEIGIWQFAFQKAGYDPLFLIYNATKTENTAAYLEKNDTLDLVTLAVHVHEGDLNGEVLSDVQIEGQDGNGNEFVQTTNSSGVAVVQGEPGAWQFAFQKEGYEVLFLKYNATRTEDTAAYLEKAD